MTTQQWDPVALTAMVWAKWLLSQRGVTSAPPPHVLRQASADPRLVHTALARHRLVAAAARSQARPPGLPVEVTRWLRTESRTVSLQALAHTGVASRFQHLLEAEGIPALFIKGVFQAQQVTGDYAYRGPGDIDIVVAPETFDDTVALFRDQGAVHEEYPGLPQLQARVAHVHHATSLIVGNTHIDLHRRLDPVPHLMRADFDDLWQRRDKVDIRGHSFATLGPVDAAVFVASHGAQDNWPRLRSVVDFAGALDLAVSEAGWDTVWERAQELGVGRRFSTAVQVARLLVPQLPAQGPRDVMMSRWAWSRHRHGRDLEGSGSPRDSMGSFVYWTLSQGDPRSLAYAVKRLLWLPSAMGDASLPENMWWAYPALAPINVGRRILARRREVAGS